MIHVVSVTEFVNDNVVDNGLRCHHAFPMEGDTAGRRVGRPTVPKFPDIYARYFDPYFRSEISNTLADAVFALFQIELAESRSQSIGVTGINKGAPQYKASALKPKVRQLFRYE